MPPLKAKMCGATSDVGLGLTDFNLLSAMLPRVRQRLTHSRIDSRGHNATGLLLPYIVWSGMIEFVLDPTDDPDQQNAQRDLPSQIVDAPSVVPFPAAAIR